MTIIMYPSFHGRQNKWIAVYKVEMQNDMVGVKAEEVMHARLIQHGFLSD